MTEKLEETLHIQAKIKQQNRGPGFWKFNNSLLRDEAYVNGLRKNINSYRAKYESIHDKGLKWDLIKMEIRGFTVISTPNRKPRDAKTIK